MDSNARNVQIHLQEDGSRESWAVWARWRGTMDGEGTVVLMNRRSALRESLVEAWNVDIHNHRV